MSQVFTQQQTNWLANFGGLVVQMLHDADALTASTTEFSDQTFGTGGANAITDATAQTVLPAATATIVAQAEGAVVAILAVIAANRGYLEAIRP